MKLSDFFLIESTLLSELRDQFHFLTARDTPRPVSLAFVSPAEYAADQMLKRCGVNRTTVPISIGQVATHMGVDVRYAPATADYTASLTMPGPQSENIRPLILLNAQEPTIRQRFALAHALGHIALGHGPVPADTPAHYSTETPNQQEQAANIFALNLLIPRQAIRCALRIGKFGNVNEMAKAFAVSPAAVATQLKRFKPA